MGRGSGQAFFKRKHLDGLQTHEKVLSINNHQGNASQTTMNDHFTTVKMLITKKIINVLARILRKGNTSALCMAI